MRQLRIRKLFIWSLLCIVSQNLQIYITPVNHPFSFWFTAYFSPLVCMSILNHIFQNMQHHRRLNCASFASVTDTSIGERPCQLNVIQGPSQAIALDSRVASSEPASIRLRRIRFNLILDECPELFLKFGLCTLLGRGRSWRWRWRCRWAGCDIATGTGDDFWL